MPVDLGRHRIEQRQLDHSGAQVARHRRPRVAAMPGLGEMRHDVGLGQRPHRLQRQELRVARPGADPDQPPAHSPGLASALTAAAAIALPPIRPATIAQGTPDRPPPAPPSTPPRRRSRPASRSPPPAAARRPPASRADGRAPSARCRSPPAPRPAARARAPAPPPTAWCRAPRPAPGVRGSRSVQTTSLPAGSRAPRHPVRHHLGIAEDRRPRRPAPPAPPRRSPARTGTPPPPRPARRRGSSAPRPRPPPRRSATGRPRRG